MYGRRPLSRFEAAIYVMIVSVLITVLLDRALDYMALADRASVEATLNNLQSAINTRVAYEVLRGGRKDPQRWLRENPFTLAAMAPRNFGGEFDTPALEDMKAGTWVFDRGRAELVYRPRLERGLTVHGHAPLLRFRLVPASPAPAIGLRLEPVNPYTWQVE